MNAHLIRTQNTAQLTTGTMSFYLDNHEPIFSVLTLELGWHNNVSHRSCIPKGLYKVSKRFNTRHGHHFILNNVKNRDMILIHVGNTIADTEGCILVGLGVGKDTSGNVTSITESIKALELMDLHCPMDFDLLID